MKKGAYALKVKREKHSSLDKKRYLGLCSYCKSESVCTFIRDPNRPVYECDEFEEIHYVSLRVSNQKKISPIHSSKNLPSPQDPPSSYKGLCMNCEQKASCIYPKPEGGVWHCEEYQ